MQEAVLRYRAENGFKNPNPTPPLPIQTKPSIRFMFLYFIVQEKKNACQSEYYKFACHGIDLVCTNHECVTYIFV